MKYCLFILTFVAASGIGRAQNPGFLGKKNVFEFNTVFNSPLISNIFSPHDAGYKVHDGQLISKRDVFDWGFRAGLTHVMKRNFAVGFETGYDYFSIYPTDIYMIEEMTDTWGYTYQQENEYAGEQEMFDVKSLMIMPKLEFTNKNGLLPIGISHQIGFGVRLMSVVQRDYACNLIDYYYYSPLSPEQTQAYKDHLIDTDNKYRGTTFMYALNMRYPVSKYLMINYGMKYTFNFMKSLYYSNYSTQSESDSYWFTHNELNDLIRDRKKYSLMQAFIGMSFAF